jgi:PAS domain S-box-containing protein
VKAKLLYDDRSDGPCLILGAVRDIDEWKRAEEALEQMKDFYEMILESVDEGVYVTDHEDRIIYFNRGMEKMSAISREDARGRDVLSDFSEETLELFRSVYLRAKHSMAPVNYDKITVVTPGGRLTYQSGEIIPQIDNDAYKGMIVTSRDETDKKIYEEELKRRQEEYDFLLGNVPSLFILLDREGRIVSASAESSKILGFPLEGIIGSHVDDLVFQREASQFHEEDRDVMETGEPLLDSVVRFTARSGRDMWLLRDKIPVFDEEGNVKGLVIFGRDITELKTRELMLERANRKLELLGNMTRHDILNQLFASNAHLDLALDHSRGEVKQHIERAMEANSCISEYLDFSRDYTRVGSDEPRWVEMREAIVGGISTLDTTGVKVNIDPCLNGLEIFADRMMEKVFHNLIGNSIRHGGEVKEVEISLVEGDGGIIITLTDDGHGIERSMKEAIFDSHSGKGLYLVKEILSITDLSIVECGENGRGARFEIRVPSGNYRNI